MNNQLDTAVLVAVLVAAGFYLCTSRRLLRVMFGFFILSNAVNLVILGVSGDPSGRRAPVIVDGAAVPSADPLPQALILTAIVIGFAVAAYLAVLVYRLYADRKVATLPAIFEGEPAPDSPAARESAEDAALRRAQREAAEARRAATDAGHGEGGHH